MNVAAPLEAASETPKRSSLSVGGRLLQRELVIGASNDPLEQEADRVADQVMAMPEQSATGSAVLSSTQRLSGQPGRQSNIAAPASVEQTLDSSYSPLEQRLRLDMEQRFGYDFSQIRVHSNAIAERSAKDVAAHAYTAGNHIAFAAGKYTPWTYSGRQLIAHELVHVLQQGKEYRTNNNSCSNWRKKFRKSMSSINPKVSLRRKEADPQTNEILELLRNHIQNYRQIMEKIRTLDKEKAKTLAKALSTNASFFEDLGGSNEGSEILISLWQAVSDDALLKGQIERALTQRGMPDTKPGQSAQAVLDRINNAIKQDSKLIDYMSPPFPLRLPVTLYEPGKEREAHVYYDPALSDSGLTPMRFQRIEQKILLPILFIKLGPSALSSTDDYLRSILYHEYVHYKQALTLRKEESTLSKDEKSARLIIEGGASGRSDPDLEVEAYSKQLVEYIYLEPDKAAHIIHMLCKHAAGALQFQWEAAKKRIVLFVEGTLISTGVSEQYLRHRKVQLKAALMKAVKLAEKKIRSQSAPDKPRQLDKLRQLEGDIQRA
jgi:hypothetical protein